MRRNFFSRPRADRAQQVKRRLAAAAMPETLESRMLMAATIYALDGTTPTSINVTEGIPLHVQAIGAAATNASLDSQFAWDFGDSGGANNKLEGFNAAHIYEEVSGTATRQFTVSLKVTDPAGVVTTDTLTVNVLDNSGFSNIYVDAVNGSDSNDGSTPALAVKTVGGANIKLQATANRDNTKVLFRNGQTFNPNGSVLSVGFPNVIIGAYSGSDGSTARPVLMNTGTGTSGQTLVMPNGSANGLVVRDLAIDDMDSSSAQRPTVVAIPGNTSPQNIALVDNELRKVTTGLVVDGVDLASIPKGILVQGNNTTTGGSMTKYLAYLQGTDLVVTGNTIHNSNEEHIVRVMHDSSNRVAIAQNDVTNVGIAKETLAIRHGKNIYVGQNIINQAHVTLGDTNWNSTTNPETTGAQYVLYDSNIHESTLDDRPAVSIVPHVDHVLFRNNIFHASARNTSSIFQIDGGITGDAMTDIRIVSNTAVHSSQGTTSFSTPFLHLHRGNTSGFELVNNLYVVQDTGEWSGHSINMVGSATPAEFERIDRNVWAQKGTGAIANTAAAGSYTLSAWNAVASVGNDTTETAASVGLDASYRPSTSSTAATYGRPYAGIFDDHYASPRPTGSGAQLAAGAVETVVTPAAPSSLDAVANSSTQVTLTWIDNSSNETGFVLERSLNSSFTTIDGTYSLGANVTSKVDTGLTGGTTYYYRVKAVIGSVGSGYATDSVTTPTVPPPPTSGTQFRQRADGLVSIEAEHFTSKADAAGKSWSGYTAISGFSGSGAMQVGPDTGSATAPNAGPQMDYEIQFQQSGQHYVWIRGLGTDSSGLSDSVHIGLNGVVPSTADNANTMPFNAYGWLGTGDGVRLTINVPSAGLHTLNVFMREDGTVVDKIIITDDVNYTPSGTDAAETPLAFQQVNGLVSMEAENYYAKTDAGGKSWTAYNSISGYSGAGAMQAGPDTGSATAPGAGPSMDYLVNFSQTGTHYVWVRGLGADSSGLSDSVHIGLDGTVPSTADNANTLPYNSYGWLGTGDAVRLTINVGTAGLHTLNLFMREDGTVIDKIIITDDVNYVPSGVDAAETR